MKCKHCGAEWRLKGNATDVEKCPFCGEVLTALAADGKKVTMSSVLHQMVELYGDNIFADERKCISIFKDIAPELKNEQKILNMALSSGIGEYFVACSENEQESSIKKAIYSMDYLSYDAKSLIISSFVNALGWDEDLAKSCFEQQVDLDDNEETQPNLSIENSYNSVLQTPKSTVFSNQVNNANKTLTNAGNSPNPSVIPPNNTVSLPSTKFSLKKIIVGVAILVVVFGGYLLFDSGKSKVGNNSQESYVSSAVDSTAKAEKQDFVTATKDGELVLYKDAYYDREPIVAKVRKNEKILILKNEHFKMYGKGMVISDYEVMGTDVKNYKLKKGTAFEILGKEKRPADNGETNYVIKLGDSGNKEISAIVNGFYFSPMYDGNWWYVKTNDGQMGWYKPNEAEQSLLSKEDRIAFMSRTETYLGFGGMLPYDTQTNDGEEIRFVGAKSGNNGTLRLISKSNNKEIFAFRDFDGRGGVEFYVRSISTKQPAISLWEITAIAGTHAKNCGYWLVGKNNGKWTIYISDKELATAGYNINRWHQLQSGIENNKLILSSSTEYYPPGAQYGYQRTHITEMEFEVYWDYNANTFRLRYIPIR